MKASAFNAALMVHSKKGDRNSQYEMMHVLESADDALTRTKMKEQFAAQTNGSLTEYLGKQSWDSEHGKHQALDLMSERRDVTTNNLAAMSADERADLEDKAAGWADKILNVTRGSDRDDSENADKIAAILGPRSPEEVEVIRKRIRLQTSGTKSTTIFEELDRTFTERDESIAMAGLGSDPVKVAQTQLVDAAAEGDPERIHAIAKQLGPESMWKLNASDPMLAGRVIASMPEDRRGEFSALMNGKQDVAEGARIAAMFQPIELSTTDALNGSAKRKLKQKEAQDPERLIAELSKSSPKELEAARKAWDEGGNGQSWDQLIAERFKDADPMVRMRVEAAASGDVIGEKALRFRQGMKSFDQSLIDGALANPDLKSTDPEKRAAAQAERRELERRLQLHDANEQRTMALLEGKSTENIQGRTFDEQRVAYFERRRHHDGGSGSGGPLGVVRDITEKDDRMATIREQAIADDYATSEMWNQGDAEISTKVRRAELAGDTAKKAEILENVDTRKNGSLAAHDANYQLKFGRDRSMLAGPDLSEAKDVAKVFARMTGDERPTEQIAAELVRSDMNAGELRMQHVRETGALTDRTREQRIAQQGELRDLTESGWLAGEEKMRFMRGGNRGSDDLHASTLALLQQSGGADVDAREFQRRDTSTTKALELQREEKQKSAASVAQALSIAAKIAALLTANPALFVAVDAGFSAVRIAAQELIANEAYDAAADVKHMAIDVAVNLATAKLASLGKGVQAGTEAAKGVQTMQRIGNVGAAMTGAAAHAAVDGGDTGGALLHAGLAAFGGNYLRGKVENAITGTSRAAGWARSGFGTLADTSASIALGGGHVDGTTAIDLIGNTVQGRAHGTHGARKAARHDHAQITHDLVTHSSDISVPRRSTASDDAIRHTTAPETDPRRSQYTRIEEHARDVESRRQAEAAYRAHAHLVDDVRPFAEAAQHVSAPGGSPPGAPNRSDATAPINLAAEHGRNSNATSTARTSTTENVPPQPQGDHAALVDLAVNESKTPEHRTQIVRWGQELDQKESFGPHREALRELHLEARKESAYPNKEHGAALREWGHEGQLDRLTVTEALRHEGVDPNAVQHVFDKAVKNDASASVKPDEPGPHTAADGTELVKPLSDHPDALTREDITFLADIHGRRSDHLHGPYTTSSGRELPGTPMRKVVPDAAAHDYQTGVRIDREGHAVPNDSVGGYVGPRATTSDRTANDAAAILGLDYIDSKYVDSSGRKVSPSVEQGGSKAIEWAMTNEQDARRTVPFGDDAKTHFQDHRRRLEETGAHIPTLYEGDHRLDTVNRGYQTDPGTGWGFSASERLVDSEGRPYRPEPNQEITLAYTKLPPYDVAHIPSSAQVARNEAAKDLFERAKAARKSGLPDPSLSTDIPGVLETARHARTSDVDPTRQARREEFEAALANHPNVRELVGPTLDMMSNKLLDYLSVMHPDLTDDKLSLLGKAPSQRGYAGAIGTDPHVIKEALNEGNVRERMVLLSEFQEQVLGVDALKDGGIDRMRERFGGEHAGAFTLADVERLGAMHARYMASLPQGAPTSPKALFDVNALDDEHSDYSRAKAEGGDTKLPQFTPEAATQHLGRQVDSATPIGEASPFARTTLTIDEANARGMALSPREVAFAQKKGGSHLPWVVGSQANIVDPEAPFIRAARDSALPLKAGISGTTFRGMRLAEVMGADPEKARLALFSQLNGIEAHSMHEIASAANGFFGKDSSSRYDVHAPYTEGTTGVDTHTLRSVAESIGISLEELNLFVGNDRNTK